MAGFHSGLSGILYVDRERFDSAEMKKTPQKLYIVDNGSTFSLYLGELPIASGDSGGTPLGILKQNKPLSEAMAAETPSGVMEWTEEVRYP